MVMLFMDMIQGAMVMIFPEKVNMTVAAFP